MFSSPSLVTPRLTRLFQACAGTRMPLYRLFRAAVRDYLYTIDPKEFPSAEKNGYMLQGTVGRMLACRVPKSIPIYRLYHKTRRDHFLTTSASESANAHTRYGYSPEGIAGYVFAPSKGGCPSAELRPLYQMIEIASRAHHFYTMNDAVKKNAKKGGYRFEKIAACIYPA